jgi:hypothetical protein
MFDQNDRRKNEKNRQKKQASPLVFFSFFSSHIEKEKVIKQVRLVD